MKKTLLFFIVLNSFFMVSQNNISSGFWENVRFGGAVGLSFGSTTHIAIAPSAVYDFNNGFSLGSGLNYTYSKAGSNSRNAYGASIISLYKIPNISTQLSAEYEHLFVNLSAATTTYDYNYPSLYVGASYQLGVIGFGIRYDLLYDKSKSIYASPISPIIRVFF